MSANQIQDFRLAKIIDPAGAAADDCALTLRKHLLQSPVAFTEAVLPMKRCVQCSRTEEDQDGHLCDTCTAWTCGECADLSVWELKCLSLKKRSLRFLCRSCSQEVNKEADVCAVVNRMRVMEQFVVRSFEDIKLKMAAFGGPPRRNYQGTRDAVLIKPKTYHNSMLTKSIVKELLDPVEVGIVGIRCAAKGGVVLTCNNTVKIVKEEAVRLLGKDFDVKIVEKHAPRIKIVNLSDQYKEDELIQTIKAQNDLLEDEPHMKLLHFGSQKSKYGPKFMAVMEVDGATFARIMDLGKLVVRWDTCNVYESLEITRCFRCNGYNHKAGSCTDRLVCPMCAGSHWPSECTTVIRKCVNCQKMKDRSHPNVNVHHAAWDNICPVYVKKTDTLRQMVDYTSDPSDFV